MAERRLGSRRKPKEEKKQRRGPFRVLSDIIAGAARLVWRGLIVAIAMGIFFGLLIGIGGPALDLENQQLYKLAGLSGWISGMVAMIVVFRKAWRERRGH